MSDHPRYCPDCGFRVTLDKPCRYCGRTEYTEASIDRLKRVYEQVQNDLTAHARGLAEMLGLRGLGF